MKRLSADCRLSQFEEVVREKVLVQLRSTNGVIGLMRGVVPLYISQLYPLLFYVEVQ